MGDSVKKYFESTSTSGIKTIYPGGIEVTIDKPKKGKINPKLITILAKRFALSEREIKDNYYLIGEDLSKDILLNIGIDEKQIKKLLK